MPRERQSEGPTIERRLADVTHAIDNLADEVKVLREVMDEIRELVSHALANDKFRCGSAEWRMTQGRAQEQEPQAKSEEVQTALAFGGIGKPSRKRS